jgi:Lactate dehydrogenase and related dehydrogenases
LANAEFFASLRQCSVFINAARGECTDTQALNAAIRSGKVACSVIDTWENEPNIDRELLDLAFIATPHIAGYSADGKANGTRMSLQHIAEHFFLTARPDLEVQAPELPQGFDYAQEVISQLPASFSASYPWLSPEITAILPHNALSQLRQYDALADTFRLHSAPESFEFQRGHYPLRRE